MLLSYSNTNDQDTNNNNNNTKKRQVPSSSLLLLYGLGVVEWTPTAAGALLKKKNLLAHFALSES